MSPSQTWVQRVFPLALICFATCGGDGVDAQVTKRGSFEVTAELLEIPEKVEILAKYTYDFALVMKYSNSSRSRRRSRFWPSTPMTSLW